jgi:hypothetical protein
MAEPEEERPARYEPSTPVTPPARPRPRAEAEAPRKADEAAPPAKRASPEEPTLDRGASLVERLALASPSQLRTRRERIDKRLVEIAEPIGETLLALEAPIHGTKLVDLDRILKKIDRVDNDIADAERLLEPRPEGLLQAIGQDIARISDRFAARELRQKRGRLVAELGLALLASDLRALEDRQPEIASFLEQHAEDARTVDDLFRQARLVDEELAARARDGRLTKEPKAIEKLFTKTGEVVGDAGGAAKDKIVDLGKTAAKSAVKQSGKAVWSLAKGAFKLGQRKLTGDEESDEDERDEDSEDERPARPRAKEGPRNDGPAEDVPDLLRRLGKLHKDGVLTDEEFAKKKADLLKRL